ncbi:unnamed protein product [Schistosoma curassoni]|uniref:2-phosphosulfolactate phosphatase n=1 Tax=Schistosoma curassoni TaxID=6186 RepID=A0A183K978_9TREM|nr:unnamed protein product [Schistosoma curassoni]
MDSLTDLLSVDLLRGLSLFEIGATLLCTRSGLDPVDEICDAFLISGGPIKNKWIVV